MKRCQKIGQGPPPSHFDKVQKNSSFFRETFPQLRQKKSTTLNVLFRVRVGRGLKPKRGRRCLAGILVSPFFQVQTRRRHIHFPETQLPHFRQRKPQRKLGHQDLLERKPSSWLDHEEKNSDTC